MELARQVCLLHPQREAAVRCPSCHQFYCRECVTEHQSRFVCAACLRKLTASGESRHSARHVVALLFGAARLLVAAMLLWLAFYFVGLFLARAPSTFHDGTIWGESRK